MEDEGDYPAGRSRHISEITQELIDELETARDRHLAWLAQFKVFCSQCGEALVLPTPSTGGDHLWCENCDRLVELHPTEVD